MKVDLVGNWSGWSWSNGSWPHGGWSGGSWPNGSWPRGSWSCGRIPWVCLSLQLTSWSLISVTTLLQHALLWYVYPLAVLSGILRVWEIECLGLLWQIPCCNGSWECEIPKHVTIYIQMPHQSSTSRCLLDTADLVKHQLRTKLLSLKLFLEHCTINQKSFYCSYLHFVELYRCKEIRQGMMHDTHSSTAIVNYKSISYFSEVSYIYSIICSIMGPCLCSLLWGLTPVHYIGKNIVTK